MLDLIIILVALLHIRKGWKKGGLAAIFNIAIYIIAIGGAFALKEVITNIAMRTSLATWVRGHVTKSTPDVANIPFIGEAVVNTAENVTRTIVMILSVLILFVILIIIFKLILRILLSLLKSIRLLGANKLLGAIIAVIPAYITIYVIVILATVLSPVLPWVNSLASKSILIHFIPDPITIFKIFV